MNEWEFTADVESWINEFIKNNGGRLPLSRAKCEQKARGSLKRRDLTIYDKNESIILTGEVKLPYNVDGGSPFIHSVVTDAWKKAIRAKSKYFFTWNINEFVLWESHPVKTSWREQKFKKWVVANIHTEKQLEHPIIIEGIKDFLSIFLNYFSGILLGTHPLGQTRPDEKFIDMLESFLLTPIECTIRDISALYKKHLFRAELDKWMREDQGWIITDDPEGIVNNLERAARFSCYALVNKLVFYEALLKRYGIKMDRLSIPSHITAGDQLRLHFESYFERAKKVTGDYETVFGESHISIGNRVPFYSDSGVPHWRQLVDQLNIFDFSKLDYEIIGTMCEKLLSPEERHKFGQFYTRVEVVDLINSFSIRKGNEKLIDPACGGGTFLVRAYSRKHELLPDTKHGQLLKDLFGIDISNFATHMTTINLATRDLIDDENYPQIARSDFFDIDSHKPFLQLPSRIVTKGLGYGHQDVTIPYLDAIVGNPPYVRQEDIPKWDKQGTSPKRGTKEYYQKICKQEAGAHLSTRSDLHCYFWPHAFSFLKNYGSLCYITSSQWLDVEYGFKLQEWILMNFEIQVIFESIAEPWFVGARVSTAITILKRQPDISSRQNNIVRFVQLRCPLSEILSNDGTTAGEIKAADDFRDEILSINSNFSDERYRVRVIKQSDLWNEGVKLGISIGNSSEQPKDKDNEDHQDNDLDLSNSDYYGGKWGIYLRAPDLWFEILDLYGDNLIPLGNIADIRFGVKSGKDRFFFPEICSTNCLNTHKNKIDFEHVYGVPRALIESNKVQLVLCGEGKGEILPIESKYLEPEIHSLMEVDHYSVGNISTNNSILLVNKRKTDLKGTYVLEYIKWGESRNYHKTATCSARANEGREWYDLTAHKRPDIILPKIQQYRLITFLNPEHLYQNSSLLGIYDVPENIVLPLCGVLNSTISILSRLFYARILGNEGNLQLDVYSAKMMLVPNLLNCKNEDLLLQIGAAFKNINKRMVFGFISEKRLRRMALIAKNNLKELDKYPDISELDMEDRRHLDDLIFQLMGISKKKDRVSLIERLYTYLNSYFEHTRQKEERAIVNKKRTNRQNPLSAREIAASIYSDIQKNSPHFLKQYERDFLNSAKPFDVFELPATGIPNIYKDMFIDHGVIFLKGKKTIALVHTSIPQQDNLILLLSEIGISGLVRVPRDSAECNALFSAFHKFINTRNKYLEETISHRTADEELKRKIFHELIQILSK